VVAWQDTLARFAGLREALVELSGKLTDDAMRKLNYAVDGRHRRPAEAVAETLRGI